MGRSIFGRLFFESFKKSTVQACEDFFIMSEGVRWCPILCPKSDTVDFRQLLIISGLYEWSVFCTNLA